MTAGLVKFSAGDQLDVFLLALLLSWIASKISGSTLRKASPLHRISSIHRSRPRIDLVVCHLNLRSTLRYRGRRPPCKFTLFYKCETLGKRL